MCVWVCVSLWGAQLPSMGQFHKVLKGLAKSREKNKSASSSPGKTGDNGSSPMINHITVKLVLDLDAGRKIVAFSFDELPRDMLVKEFREKVCLAYEKRRAAVRAGEMEASLSALILPDVEHIRSFILEFADYRMASQRGLASYGVGSRSIIYMAQRPSASYQTTSKSVFRIMTELDAVVDGEAEVKEVSLVDGGRPILPKTRSPSMMRLESFNRDFSLRETDSLSSSMLASVSRTAPSSSDDSVIGRSHSLSFSRSYVHHRLARPRTADAE